MENDNGKEIQGLLTEIKKNAISRISSLESASTNKTVLEKIPAIKEKINQLDAKKRLMNFQEVANKIKVDYRKNLINENVNVLFENKTKKENKYFGRDEYFNSVIVENNEDLVGKIKSIKILNVNHNTLFGEVISDMSKKNYAA